MVTEVDRGARGQARCCEGWSGSAHDALLLLSVCLHSGVSAIAAAGVVVSTPGFLLLPARETTCVRLQRHIQLLNAPGGCTKLLTWCLCFLLLPENVLPDVECSAAEPVADTGAAAVSSHAATAAVPLAASRVVSKRLLLLLPAAAAVALMVLIDDAAVVCWNLVTQG